MRYVQPVVAAAAVLLAAGCGQSSRSSDGDAAVAVTVSGGIVVASLVITVDAADIERPLVFNLPLQNGTATGTLRIPPGQLRTLSAVAFESGGAIAAEGAVTLQTVERGWNPPVSIPMVSRAGHVPISIQIGPVSVAVAPASPTLVVGERLQLAARITAASGDEISDAPEWATSDPAVLEVTSAGLVTALRAGQADVVAVYAGVAGVSRITCSATGSWIGVKQLGTAANDYPHAVALDAQGNVYVAGVTYGAFPGHDNAGASDAFVAKLGAGGDVAWVKPLGTAGDEYASGLAVDPQGNVWISGVTSGAFPGYANAGYDDAFVARVDATGAVSVRQFGTAQRDSAEAAAVDAQGNVWISGITAGDVAFVARLDAAGETAAWTELDALAFMSCPGLALDAQGNAYLSGAVDRSPSMTFPIVGVFVAKISTGGAAQVTELPHDAEFAYLGGLAVDGLGNAWVVGIQETVAHFWDAWITRLDASLAVAWPIGFPFGLDTDAAQVAVDPLGDVYVAGSAPVCRDCTDADAFIAKLDANGERVWSPKPFGTAGFDYARGLALDAEGNAYVAGSTTGTFPGNVNAGADDVFVAKLGPSGALE
jgi:hypothetical protein